MHQHMQVPPLEGRARCNYVNLPLINGDRLKTAKSLVDKAIKEKKVFSVQGPYPVIRAGLRARGWVERRLPRPSVPWPRRHDLETEATDEGDNSDDDDLGEEGERDDEADDLYDLMSRLVRNEMAYFYWTTKRDSVDSRSLCKDQMTNHYAKAGSFTTKVGLCMSLRSLQWFDAADPDTFFPRCYRLGAEDDKHAFIEDFRRTACTSLLKYVLEKYAGDSEWKRTREVHDAKSHGLSKPRKQHAKQRVGSSIIDNALHVCQEYLNSLEHCDIDMTLETTPTLSEQQWEVFLQNYYLVIHEGVRIEGCEDYVERCKCVLEQMHCFCPQMETDGLCNIWIIKPGAMSRGRGIMCMNKLDEIMSLVDTDHGIMNDSKWVVQKYLEQPLLVHDTKFDVRQWFLVTDWNPLTVWFYRECYLRFSTQPYSTHTLDSSVHLCNNSIQKHFQPSPDRNPSLPAECMWSCSQFRSWLAASGRGDLWEGVVVPGMQKAVIQTLLTAQDSVEPRKASFELYGADFMLGRDFRPWLLEINASPTMAPSTGVTAQLCPAVQEDTLRVVLDRRCDRNTHTGGFQLIYKQAAVEVPQYVGVNLLVEGTSIRRPRAPVYKPLIQSHPHLLSKSSSHRSSLISSHCISGKENQSEEAKKAWSTLSSRKVMLEKSLIFHRKLRKRPHRLVLPSTCCVLPNPAELHPQKLSLTHAQPNHPPTHRTHSNLPSLYRPTPSLDVINLRPRQTLASNRYKHEMHTVNISYQVLHVQKYLPLNHRQAIDTFTEREGPKSS
ncbi:tubulin monoglycylase TTLL3-like isoform X1 [Carassius carassius]|uniref:tubulin monoglycylase TTLL3-like isoform X1 n=1 Tax=Carassius carassius TaxID=217509 RepID=UPI0028697A3F|nr:tubulin monoglycylase TTLL3-like isoform X1 [Carassius carassius]XP_059416044.1 tubulin monoglycylase TTLL3-like isoform X1 [Carassius carassius]